LRNLTYLHLGYNQIKTLSRDIGNLKKLRDLYLGNNQITSYPKEIGYLKNLEWLSLGLRNDLNAYIPKEICNLKYVIMNYNNFCEV